MVELLTVNLHGLMDVLAVHIAVNIMEVSDVISIYSISLFSEVMAFCVLEQSIFASGVTDYGQG